jgi:hypothetical protein
MLEATGICLVSSIDPDGRTYADSQKAWLHYPTKSRVLENLLIVE